MSRVVLHSAARSRAHAACISGLAYCITYTAVRTFTAAPYLYNAFEIGLVLLFFGIGACESAVYVRRRSSALTGASGNMGGSVLGGRWSDYVLSTLQTARGGKIISEVCAWRVRTGAKLTPGAHAGPAAKHEADDAAAPARAGRVRVDRGEEDTRLGRMRTPVAHRILVHVRTPPAR